MFVDLFPVRPYCLAVPENMKVVGPISSTKPQSSVSAVLVWFLYGCDEKSLKKNPIYLYFSSITPAMYLTRLRTIVVDIFSPSSTV